MQLCQKESDKINYLFEKEIHRKIGIKDFVVTMIRNVSAKLRVMIKISEVFFFLIENRSQKECLHSIDTIHHF